MTKSITIYGIKNCDTMKKARGWLDSHGVAYDFHDYKTAGIAKDKLKGWSDELGWETLLNRAGDRTTNPTRASVSVRVVGFIVILLVGNP